MNPEGLQLEPNQMYGYTFQGNYYKQPYSWYRSFSYEDSNSFNF